MLLKEYYWFFRKALSNEVCDKIIEAGLRRPKLKGTVGNSKDVDVVEKTTRHSVVSWLDDNWIYNLLHPYIQLANTNAGWNFEWDYSEPMQFTVYKKINSILGMQIKGLLLIQMIIQMKTIEIKLENFL
jgi:hypothetical protein